MGAAIQAFCASSVPIRHPIPVRMQCIIFSIYGKRLLRFRIFACILSDECWVSEFPITYVLRDMLKLERYRED